MGGTVTLEDLQRDQSVTGGIGSKDVSPKAAPWSYDPLPLVTDCPVCYGARWACEHTPIEELTQIELLTKDNRILSQAVDSLRDLTTEQGATLSQAMKRIDMLEKTLFETRSALIDALDHVIRLQLLISGKPA